MEVNHLHQLPVRMRRLRRSPNIRDLVCECRVGVSDLIMPLFVKAGITEPEPISSMPGIFRYSPEGIVEECRALRELGIKAVALFPCTHAEVKDARGSEALNPDGLVPSVVRSMKQAALDLITICDVALDPYTSHGHDGVLSEDEADVDNDATVEILSEMAVVLGQAGCDWVAPSDMMDGRVGAIRRALDETELTSVAILAYSAKFNSAYYGPFRDAIGSKKATGGKYLDKGTYQLNPANSREAVRDALLDEEEGADLLMVKPAGAYLDIISRLREVTVLPLAAYQVSGEFSQVHAAAQLGWLEYERMRDESLLAIKRAGADLILSYFAKEVAQEMSV
ncbi:MAG: Delta-aminolevulinic acid dehydratase [Verrucomicrobia subdivision 3 bacterium]|nr:Delta-aminolevulinic acid dehydratase [Limisphaerales bacterium]MCS1412661.1 Delta-aminolevulinic acid dehydratase [Limisphaerales bacterium]